MKCPKCESNHIIVDDIEMHYVCRECNCEFIYGFDNKYKILVPKENGI